MGEFQSFAETLEKKIRQELISEMTAKTHSSHSTWGEDLPPTVETSYPYMSWLLGQIPVHQNKGPQRSYAKTPYVQYKVPPRPRKPHKLSPQAQQAMKCLQRYCTELGDNFNEQELRKAYRKSLLATHPDHTEAKADPQAFWEVQQSYKTLKQILV